MNNPRLTIKELSETYIYNKPIKDTTTKSYSHKPHLALLPYDLNTNDPKKLKERLKVCNRELRQAQSELKTMKESEKGFKEIVKELTDENKELTSKLDKAKKLKSEISDHLDEVKEMSKKDSQDIIDDYNSFINDNIMGNINPGIDLDYLDDMMNLHFGEDHYFGYQNGMGVKNLNKLADDIETIVGASTDGTGNPSEEDWQVQGVSLADNIREYAHKYDMTNTDTKHGEQFDKLVNKEDWMSTPEMESLEAHIEENSKNIKQSEEALKELPREISKQETKVKDFKEHKDKIKDKISKVEG